MQYADALAMQVESHQITEAEAMARFAEYKTKTIQGPYYKSPNERGLRLIASVLKPPLRLPKLNSSGAKG